MTRNHIKVYFKILYNKLLHENSRNFNSDSLITAYISNLTEAGILSDVWNINISTIGLYYVTQLFSKAIHAMIEDATLIVKFDGPPKWQATY